MPGMNEITLHVTVEFEDVDSYRIAHHTKLVAYLERARVRLLSEAGLDLSTEGMHLVLYNLDMRFVKPARLLDELVVSAFVESIDDFRVVLGYRIRRGGDLVAKAATDLVFFDSDSGSLAPVPVKLAERLKAYMKAGGKGGA
jgi:YbgC/YbaW family acyl-CoA thioester hydrolase